MATGFIPQQTVATLGALNAAVQAPIAYDGVMGIQLAGTLVGTVAFEESIDYVDTSGTATATWVASPAYSANAHTSVTSTNIFPAQWYVPCGGFNQFRVRISAYTSGTLTVTIVTGVAPFVGATGAITPSATNVQTNATVTASANSGDIAVPPGVGYLQLTAVASGTVTGTTPTLQYAIQFKDIQLGTQYYTVLTYPAAGNITATGQFQILLVGTSVPTTTPAAVSQLASAPGIPTLSVRVTWTVTGTTPSFGGVYSTINWISS